MLAAFAFINSFNEESEFDKLWYVFKKTFLVLKYTRAFQVLTKIHSLQWYKILCCFEAYKQFIVTKCSKLQREFEIQQLRVSLHIYFFYLYVKPGDIFSTPALDLRLEMFSFIIFFPHSILFSLFRSLFSEYIFLFV